MPNEPATATPILPYTVWAGASCLGAFSHELDSYKFAEEMSSYDSIQVCCVAHKNKIIARYKLGKPFPTRTPAQAAPKPESINQ